MDEDPDHPLDVAVKIERHSHNLLGMEMAIYKKLEAFDDESISESPDCIPRVYHLKEKFKIGTMEVNILFMQRLGKTLDDYLEKGVIFSLAETLMAGATLVK